VGKIACRAVAAWARRVRDFAYAFFSGAPPTTFPGGRLRRVGKIARVSSHAATLRQGDFAHPTALGVA
jgi:hypothetical protein